VLECVINVSEGRPGPALDAITASAGGHLLDLHRDADHNRSVLTLGGPEVESAARRVAQAAISVLDLRHHAGAHPRIGVLDVVPFVPLTGSVMADAIAARDRFADYVGNGLDVPCFLYGPERTLPEVRAGAFTTIAPDVGPLGPHERAGACAVGARDVLVAYNVWLAAPDLPLARSIARSLRSPAVRALGLAVGDVVQVSMNLIDPLAVGPEVVYDQVAAAAAVDRAELVGLAPEAVVAAVPPSRWAALDLAPDRTIEARLAAIEWRSET
jgi:glutamate formiminotransferase